MLKKDKHNVRAISRILYCSLAIAMALAPFELWATQAKKPASLLIVNSYHPGYSWSDDIMNGIRKVLEDETDLTIFQEYLDTKRQSSAEYYSLMKHVFKLKYAQKKLDVIAVSDDNALNFILEYRDELFPGVPVIACGIDNEIPNNLNGVYFVKTKSEYHDNLKMMLRLHPNAKEIVIVTDRTKTGESIRKKLENFNPGPGISLNFLSDYTFDELGAAVQELPGSSLLFHWIFVRDSSGKTRSLKESRKMVVEKSRLPVYISYSYFSNIGLAGGLVVSGYNEGIMVGELAARIINNDRVDKIPLITIAPLKGFFDYNVLTHFNVDLAMLPKDSTIENKPSSFYQKYKKEVWSLIVVFAVLIIVLLFLIANIRKRIIAENDLRAFSAELETAKIAAEKADIAKSQFMSNMGHELLTPLNAILGFSEISSSFMHDENGKKYLKKVEHGGKMLLTMINDILQISTIEAGKYEPNHTKIEPKSLLAALCNNYQDEVEKKGLKLITKISPELPNSITTDEAFLRQALLKLIDNSIKFTESGFIEISADNHPERENQVIFSIQDTGPGINADEHGIVFNAFEQQKQHQASKFIGSGLGLTICKKLIEMLEGQITLESVPGEGSKFSIIIKNHNNALKPEDIKG